MGGPDDCKRGKRHSGGSSPLGVLVSNGNPPFTYNWEPAATLDDPTSSMPVATPVGDTDYMVTVTSAVGCSDVATVVVVNSNVIVGTIMPGDTAICPDAALQLLAGGGSNYQWQANPNNPPGGMLSPLNVANPVFSGGLADSVYQYQAIVTDAAFPAFADTVELTITILPEPDITITKDPAASTCAGDQVTLTASGADSYTWIDAATGIVQGVGPTLSVSPTTQTVYQAYGPNAFGCIDTSEITVNLLPPPVVLTPITDLQNCDGDTVMVSIEIDDDIQSYIISGTGAFTNDQIIGTNILTFNAIFTVAPATFDVEIIGNTTGCSVTESFAINSCVCVPAPSSLAGSKLWRQLERGSQAAGRGG